MHYRITHVDENEYGDDIAELERLCALPKCPYDDVWWWLTFWHDAPIGYIGLMPSIRNQKTIAYLVRVGVIREHRGHGLQARMMRTVEQFARRHAFKEIISDTTDNPPSANNFIRCGYLTYSPVTPWSFRQAIYWRKVL